MLQVFQEFINKIELDYRQKEELLKQLEDLMTKKDDLIGLINTETIMVKHQEFLDQKN